MERRVCLHIVESLRTEIKLLEKKKKRKLRSISLKKKSMPFSHKVSVIYKASMLTSSH